MDMDMDMNEYKRKYKYTMPQWIYMFFKSVSRVGDVKWLCMGKGREGKVSK